ncbi:hypothetical protein [Methanobrevibacter sp.]|uniref:hypothetical protein n=1 Tax=Methanobrevibacter sp. TaxID=66852 RepID=UPI002636D596|nr:hypothetical protein [uncultured Methanobrevibacter sp.]
MITDMIEFGKWLDKNNLSDFGNDIKPDDYILSVSFENAKFKINDEIVEYEKYSPNIYNDSIFKRNMKTVSDQSIKIPSNSNLSATTPFLLQIKLKNNEDKELNTFNNKFKRSRDANLKNKEFIDVIEEIFNNLNDEFPEKLKNFIDKKDKKEIIELVNNYFSFLDDNKEIISEKIREKDIYNKNLLITCFFNSENDLINDIIFYYIKYLKDRNQQITPEKNSKCNFCDNTTITFPTLSSYSLNKSAYLFNYTLKDKNKLKNSKFKICKKCENYVKFAEDKLRQILNKNNNILIIPINVNGDYADFLKISNEEISSFEKINKFMKESNGFNYDLAVYKRATQGITIEKYIENYKSYLAKFDNINLYGNDKLNYLLNQSYKKGKKEKSKIENIFDLEHIFTSFFVDIDEEGQYKYPKLYHFYEIYTKDFRGKSGIFNGFDNRLTSTFSKYMHSIFNFIYQLNEDALNRNMLNDIVYNSIIKLQKYNKNYEILKRLNYYFMLKKELLGEDIMEMEKIEKLKESLQSDNDDFSKIVNEEPALKYYLLGQFLRYIDNFKRANNKNSDVFSNFINNVNRNNVYNLFVSEVLQKNNFYIEKMSKKGKLIFKVFENDINSIFNEPEGFSYEDYILLMFTGYYTDNLLKSDKKESEGDTND